MAIINNNESRYLVASLLITAAASSGLRLSSGQAQGPLFLFNPPPLFLISPTPCAAIVFSTIPTICTSLTPTLATLRGGSGNCSASWVGALGDGGGGREAGLNLNPAAAGGVKTNCYHSPTIFLREASRGP